MSATESERLILEAEGRIHQLTGHGGRHRRSEWMILGGGPPPPSHLLAEACRAAGRPEEEAALDKVLAAVPRNIGALLLKGDCRARAGDRRAAVSFYAGAFAVAADAPGVSMQMRGELDRALAYSREADALFERQLEGHLARNGMAEGARSPRFQMALDILLGRKQLYLQQPNSFYFPGLPQIQFYEREVFPWLAEVEAMAPAMRAELEAVLADEGGFQPYVEVNPDRPPPPNHLLGDPSWSAFYLWKSGREVPENAARCPRTMEALSLAPMPRIEGRSPMALFSLLKPGTHIKPHHGLLNTRLICHIPLIAPPGCRLRVGNEERVWEQGKALVFDDSFEHEAWNEGSETRVVLLFEIWRPEIAQDERAALTAMFEAITAFQG